MEDERLKLMLEEAANEFEKLGYSKEELEDIANKLVIIPHVNLVSAEEIQEALRKAL